MFDLLLTWKLSASSICTVIEILCERKDAVTLREAENSDDDKESCTIIPKPPNLAGRANKECCSAAGGSWPVKAGINFVVKASSSFRKQEKVPGNMQPSANKTMRKIRVSSMRLSLSPSSSVLNHFSRQAAGSNVSLFGVLLSTFFREYFLAVFFPGMMTPIFEGWRWLWSKKMCSPCMCLISIKGSAFPYLMPMIVAWRLCNRIVWCSCCSFPN